MAGKIYTIGYKGFDFATGSTAPGILMWSGSFDMSGSADDLTSYTGVGIEAVLDGNNYLRFDAGASSFDVHAEKFFLGSTNTAFISGSGDGTIAISSSNFLLTEDGEVSMSGNITAAGGTIANWVIEQDKLASKGFETGGVGTGIRLVGGKSPNLIMQSESSDNRIRMYYESTTDWGLKGRSGGQDVFQLGIANNIAGWTFDDEKFTGGNMIIKKSGTIQSANFASNVAGSGFKLTAEDGGFLEVENARIRGTLSTTTFEKETVNAVGGQLYVANSTTLTGSGELGGSTADPGIHRSTDTTMSVVNVSGFEQGEILCAKKVTQTGFNAEYLYVESSSRTDAASDTDFSGKLYVLRAFGSGDDAGDSGSLGDTPATAVEYSGSQVIVSTGKLNTGYIRLNANPNDAATPYIDIVERTGSAIYDVLLKARLGDLSGLADSDYVFNESNPGFGLATDNVYLQGGIKATFGEIGGFVITSNAISSSNNVLRLKDNGQITGSSVLFTGGKIGGFTISASEIKSSNNSLRLKSSGQITGSLVKFTGGQVAGWSISATELSKNAASSTDHISIDSSGTPKIQIGGDSKTRIEISNQNLKFISGSATYDTVATYVERFVGPGVREYPAQQTAPGYNASEGFDLRQSRDGIKIEGPVEVDLRGQSLDGFVDNAFCDFGSGVCGVYDPVYDTLIGPGDWTLPVLNKKPSFLAVDSNDDGQFAELSPNRLTIINSGSADFAGLVQNGPQENGFTLQTGQQPTINIEHHIAGPQFTDHAAIICVTGSSGQTIASLVPGVSTEYQSVTPLKLLVDPQTSNQPDEWKGLHVEFSATDHAATSGKQYTFYGEKGTIYNDGAMRLVGLNSATQAATFAIRLADDATNVHFMTRQGGSSGEEKKAMYRMYNNGTIANEFRVTGTSKFGSDLEVGDDIFMDASSGQITKISGNFVIPHPDPSKPDHKLRHSFVESPTAGDNLYRWQVETKSGTATIQLPDYYKFLNENDQVWVSPVRHFGQAWGEVNAEQTELQIHSSEDGLYNVLLIGTRKDELGVANWDRLGLEPLASDCKKPENRNEEIEDE